MLVRRFGKILTVSSLFSAFFFGQQEMGSIVGLVSDPTGSAVTGAQVDIKNESTGQSFLAQTDSTGTYRAPQLAPGVYTITVKRSGFATIMRPGIEVRVGDRLRLDIGLEVGNIQEVVTVRSEAPMLQTEDATTGQLVNTERILDLPLNGRDWLQLATLSPGTVMLSNTSATPQQVLLNIGGARVNQNNFLINGMDDTQYVGGGQAVVFPPVDSLQEFRVETNDYTADTGRLAGGVINATIKSGSNAIHGTVYEFLRNRELNARNFFANPAAAKPEFTRNQFGASVGGPFLKDKLFFFLNYEGNRQRQDVINSTNVFSAAQKSGDFSAQLGSQVGVDAQGNPVRAGEIYDPFSLTRLANGTAVRDPFPGNIIPASRINPVSAVLIALVPPPTSSGSPNYFKDLSAPFNQDTFAGRVDWVHSTKDTVEGHIVYADANLSTAPLLGFPADGTNSNSTISDQRLLGLAWTHVFRPTDLNEFRIGYLRNAGLSQPGDANLNLNAQYGIPFGVQGPLVGALAQLSISGFATIGTNLNGPFFQYVNKYEMSDTYTAIRGSHTLQAGFLGMLKLFQNQLNCNYCRGYEVFNGVFSSQVGFSNTGSSVADFLLGTASSAQYANVTNEKDIGHEFDAFVQDRWQAARNLTISAGLRYDYNPPSWEARGQISSLIYGPNYTNPQIVVPKNMSDANYQFMKNVLFPYLPVMQPSNLDLGLVHNTYPNFSPRLGIAYRIGSKMVVRAGYGIFRGFPDVVSGAVLTVNPPSKLIISQTTNNVDPTIILNQSVFGPSPFNRPQVNPNFFSIRNVNMPTELTQMYNLMVQREIARGWVAEVGFMGNRSSRILIVNQINDAVPALPADTSSPQSRRRVSPLLGNLPLLTPEGFSNYNALTLSLEKRFTAGFSVQANYTWSRALGVAPAVTDGINNSSIENPLNLKREYGPLDFDIVNRFVVSYLYELPFGKGRRFLNGVSAAVDALLGGWQVNGITTLQGGFPITPVLNFSLGKTFTNSRPDAVGDPTNSARQPYQWLNPAAFAVPGNAQIAAGDFFGNTGRSSVREPGLVNFDFSLFKSFRIREHKSLQFRAEFFNLTNTPFFGQNIAVDVTYESPTFGRVTTAGDPRVAQVALKFIY
jgi:hypothetical protein